MSWIGPLRELTGSVETMPLGRKPSIGGTQRHHGSRQPGEYRQRPTPPYTSGEFDQRIQECELQYLASSPHAQASAAAQYAGLPFEETA